MSESDFTPEELSKIELNIPAFQRKGKIEERIKLRRRLENPALRGGTSSSLDPINPQKLKGFGEPTIPLGKAWIKKPGEN